MIIRKLRILFNKNPRSFIHFSFLILLSLSATGLSSSVINAAEESGNKQQNIPILTVNINKASAEEISDVMTGIGIKKATVIVEHRDKMGEFKSLEDLLRVKGIGPATLKKNRHKLKL